MKAKIIKLLTGAAGPIITPLIASAVSAGLLWLAKYAPDSVATVDQPAVVAWIVGVITASIYSIATAPERKATKQIQREVNKALPPGVPETPVDGVSLGDTKRAVRVVIAEKNEAARRAANPKQR